MEPEEELAGLALAAARLEELALVEGHRGGLDPEPLDEPGPAGGGGGGIVALGGEKDADLGALDRALARPGRGGEDRAHLEQPQVGVPAGDVVAERTAQAREQAGPKDRLLLHDRVGERHRSGAPSVEAHRGRVDDRARPGLERAETGEQAQQPPAVELVRVGGARPGASVAEVGSIRS